MYDKKLKRVNKELQQENAELRLKNHDLVQLFIKYDLLPHISMMDCECKAKPRCVSCEARDILESVGFNVEWKPEEKSSIIIPGDIVTP